MDWKLTPAQQRVMQAFCEKGGSSKDVARALDCETWTVVNHIQSAKEKMRARSRLEAVLMYDRAARGAA